MQAGVDQAGAAPAQLSARKALSGQHTVEAKPPNSVRLVIGVRAPCRRACRAPRTPRRRARAHAAAEHDPAEQIDRQAWRKADADQSRGIEQRRHRQHRPAAARVDDRAHARRDQPRDQQPDRCAADHPGERPAGVGRRSAAPARGKIERRPQPRIWAMPSAVTTSAGLRAGGAVGGTAVGDAGADRAVTGAVGGAASRPGAKPGALQRRGVARRVVFEELPEFRARHVPWRRVEPLHHRFVVGRCRSHRRTPFPATRRSASGVSLCATSPPAVKPSAGKPSSFRRRHIGQ